MFLPRFSIRTLLGLTVVGAFIAWIHAAAFRGQPWALAISISIWFVAIVFAIHVAIFLGVYLFASTMGLMRTKTEPSSPFASVQPPPQYVTPVDQE